MGRVSRAVADQHREQMVTAATRLFQERGLEGVTVAEIMAEVGLTTGSLYRHFDSKAALAADAISEAFSEVLEILAELADQHRHHREQARQELAEFYLSPESRVFPARAAPPPRSVMMCRGRSRRARCVLPMWRGSVGSSGCSPVSVATALSTRITFRRSALS